jgi:hypothetical protein
MRCIDAEIRPAVAAAVVKHFGVTLNEEGWSKAKALLKGTSTHFATIVIKTWLNSWATTSRFHDGRCFHCVFGCPGKDDALTHYVACKRLWCIVRVAFGDAPPPGYVGDVADRVLVADPTQGRLHRLVLAYHTFHAIRGSHIDLVRSAGRSRSFDALKLASLAEARATVRRFSLS